jgi:hypothetical protein
LRVFAVRKSNEIKFSAGTCDLPCQNRPRRLNEGLMASAIDAYTGAIFNVARRYEVVRVIHREAPPARQASSPLLIPHSSARRVINARKDAL